MLGKDEPCGSCLSEIQAAAKVPWHRIPVVPNQNTILLSCDFEERRICSSSQSGRLHVEDVDGWLASAETHNDAGVEIFIRHKADGHARFEPIFSRAACKRANISRFDWLSGGTVRSGSRWL